MIYKPEWSLGEARKLYFELNGFGEDGGYTERWIKVKVWRLPVWLPNTEGRRRAVRLHDLHHIVTEYPTTWRGEAEISAWEVGGGGLRRYYAGWLLDLMNIAQGLLINPRGLYRAFVRGRRSANLYSGEFTDELLAHSVGEFRRRLLPVEEPHARPTLRDRAAFVFWVLAGVAAYVGSLLVAFSPLLLLLLLRARGVL
ncbi:MAG TPA: hypothetical protein VKB12_09075 [Pyrinomonadaceae bacterium]|nr:hypothetical protein [Pyrinomonadaceae bacterium]